ncbi:MAG TPA: hypothetical protein VGA40_02900 [Candidatus Acidoferrales bacterium]
MAADKTVRSLFHCVLVLAAAFSTAAQTWRPMGPSGGDVRALAADPRNPDRIYLGVSDGHIFVSNNAGESWEFLSRAGSRRDSVISAILVDPRDSNILFAATYTQDPTAGGGLFRSEDAGRTWRASGLAGEAVRALAYAPSNPGILVAGTLTGVFRSPDAGRNWERISPQGHEEIRQLDSVAIDPQDPDIIYIGTYHLPWKTTDGGRRWTDIHAGMIDDSDVMSIIVDRTNRRRIFASSCSGIYRSDNGGALWKKIQGIPFAARRTHAIVQDPQHPRTLYAGTTEGLWKSSNLGETWQRVTPQRWVINAMVVHPAREGRIVLGTDRLGVLASDDAAKTFRAANDGFNHRQIVALAMDRQRAGRVLAVLANAPEPVLATDDGGRTWGPVGPGLPGEGVSRIYATPEGWLAALARGGLMRYDTEKGKWERYGQVTGEAAATTDRRGRVIPARVPRPMTQHVTDMAFTRDAWFAATPQGLLVSRDNGRLWELFAVGPMALPIRSVRASFDGRRMWVASLRGMLFSKSGGQNWTWHDLPFGSGGALRIEVADEDTLLALSPTGLYVSRDAGATWQLSASGIPAAPVQDLAVVRNVFLASMQTGGLYVSLDRGKSWERVEGALAEGFFPVVASLDAGSVIFAASASEGLFAVEFPRDADPASGPSPNR